MIARKKLFIKKFSNGDFKTLCHSLSPGLKIL
jgi:hypothetical protein